MFVNYMGVGSDSSELLADFISGKEEEDNGIELNLGLSLNGKFGMDPTKDGSKFTNASPPSDFPLISEDKSIQLPPPAVSAPEASNSPILKAEKRGKRKELQLFSCEAKKNKIVENISFSPNSDSKNSLINSGGQGLAAGNSNEDGLPPWLKSVGSRSMSSSGLSELEKQSVKAVCGNTETRASPGSAPSFLTNEGLKLPSVIPGPSVANAEEKRVENSENVLKNRMLTMPPVSAVGPNGRRVDGILYRYIRGGEVQIVCVCHGSFLSPAEFVKHAGVDEVENPLKHIIVNPSVHQD